MPQGIIWCGQKEFPFFFHIGGHSLVWGTLTVLALVHKLGWLAATFCLTSFLKHLGQTTARDSTLD